MQGRPVTTSNTFSSMGLPTDNTLEIKKSTLPKGQANRGTQIISEPDHGIYDALNKGIRLATGDIIGFLHADDTFASNTIIQKIADSFSSQTTQNTAFPLLSGEMSGVKHAGGRTERSAEEMSGISGQRGVATHQIHGIYGNLLFDDAKNTDKVVRTWQSKPFHPKNVRHGWAPPHPTLFLRKEVHQSSSPLPGIKI
jgi:glycosyltransferase